MMHWQGLRYGAAFLGLAAITPASAETVKIGLVLSLSGAGADIGQNIQHGVDLYIKLHKQELKPGVEVQIITRDDGSNPANTKRLAQELIVRDHVQMLAGFTLSPSAITVAPVSTEAKIPTVIMNATTGSITRLSPYLVRVSHSNWQMGYTLGIWAAKHGITSAYTLASDYAAGIDHEAAFTRGFTDSGGKIVGSDRTPLTTTDYLPYMDRIKAAAPQSMFLFAIAGPGTIAAMKAFADSGLQKAGVQLMGSGDVVPDDELPEIGPAAVGAIDASIYIATNPLPKNVQFVKDWKQAYGPTAPPDFGGVAGYTGMAAIYEVANTLGAGATGDAAMAVLSHFTFDGPQGPIMIDPETRDVIENVTIAKIEKIGDVYENVPIETVPNVKDPWKVLNPVK